MLKLNVAILLILGLTQTVLADDGVVSERVSGIAISAGSFVAAYVSFTLMLDKSEIDIKGIDYFVYTKDPTKDEKTAELKIVKATNCIYPKEWVQDYIKNRKDPTIQLHGWDNVRPIIFWCDNDIKFGAYYIISGSQLDQKVAQMTTGSKDLQPLSDGRIIMFKSAGYISVFYEDVTGLQDPHGAIMARLLIKSETDPPLANKLVSGENRGPQDSFSLLNKLAPNFTLIMLDKNKPHQTLQIVENKIWVLFSWASWCRPCLDLIPSISQAKRNSNAIWIGVNYDESPDYVLKTLTQADYIFDYLLQDKDKEIATKYQLVGLPNLLIIDKQGIIRYHSLGKLPNVMQEVTSVIKQLNESPL